MSVMALFGAAVLGGLLILVALFIVAVVLGVGADSGDDYADSDTIDESFHLHGVHFG